MTQVGYTRTASHPELKVYPNPTRDLLYIELGDGQQAQLRLLDLQGRLLQLQQNTQPLQVLDLSALPAGLYLLEITSESWSETIKVGRY